MADLVEVPQPLRERGFGGEVGFGSSPALLIIDFQSGFTDPELPLGADASREIEQTNVLIAAARQGERPILASLVAYRDPELRDAGIWPRKMAGLSTLRAGTVAAEYDPRLDLRPSDVLFEKTHASCFFRTDLDVQLRQLGVDTLVIAGCTTSGCVRATVVDACQLGYRAIVAREAVGDRSIPAHEQSLIDIETKYGDVRPVSEIVKAMCRSDS